MAVLAVFFSLLTLYDNRQLRLMQPHRWGRLLFLASKSIRLSSCSKLCRFIVLNKSSIFYGAVVGVLTETLQDTYLYYKTTKEMWDTLNTEYRGLDIDTELYIIEQYHNYQMVDGKSVVTQAHEIQCMVKELRLLKIIVPDEFVAGGIIAKLAPSWRDFSTALKHKRVDMSISNLITPLWRKLGPRTDDLKELRVKPAPTWCTSRKHMAKAKLRRIRITTSQSKQLSLRRRRRIRRMRVVSCMDLLIIGQRSAQTAKEEHGHIQLWRWN
jgi:hypothetical protein